MKSMCLNIRPALYLLAWALTQLSLLAQPGPVIGSWPGYPRGQAADVMVINNLAYVAVGSAGLAIFDVSDAAQPVRLGAVGLNGFAATLQVVGGYAYVANSFEGFAVVDVRNPTNPVRVGSLNTIGYAVGVHVAGHYAFVADDTGLRIIDVSDPASPTEVGTYSGGFCHDVQVVGNYAYLASGALGVVDVTNPANPVLAGFLSTGGSALGLQVVGNLAYVAAGSGGLQILDVSNPATPVTVGHDSTTYAQNVHVVGNYAYVAGANGGLHVIDVSNPANPTRVGGHDAGGYAYAVFVAGQHAYVAGVFSDFQIFDVSNPDQLMRTASVQTYGDAMQVQVAGRYAYLLDGPRRLQVIDVLNPTNPVRVGGCDSTNYIVSFRVTGNRAYLAVGSAGLEIVDLSNPAEPARVGGFDTGNYANRVHVDGSIAYVADVGSLAIIDVSNPAAPRQVGSYETNGSVIDVQVSGSHAYVVRAPLGLDVVNVSQPAAPVRVGHWPAQYPSRIQVVGSRAYLRASGLHVLNVGNPANPVHLGTVNATAQDYSIAGNLAYLIVSGLGVQIFDLSDPAVPACVGGYVTPGIAQGIHVAGDYVYVADGGAGLTVGLARPGPVPPRIREFRYSDSIYAGDNATLSVSVFPCTQSYRYQWRFNGVALPGATNDALHLTNVATNQAGNYQIVVSGPAGAVTSAAARVSVITEPPSAILPTYIFSNPPAVGMDLVWCADFIRGHPRPTFQWQFNGVDLPGETNRCLLLAGITTNRSGIYTVVLSNFVGVAVAGYSAPLTVREEPPLFTAHPAGQTVVEGATMVLEGFAAPFGAARYWLLVNGTNANVPPIYLSTTTNVSFILPDVTAAAAGPYAMVASNALGVVTSAVANVTVTPPGRLDRWTRRNPLPQSQALLSVAEGNGTFVAVGVHGAILTSTNGVDWDAQPRLVDTSLRGVTWGADMFVAVGDGGIVLTSPDGANWTGRSSGQRDFLQGIAYGNGRFVAVGSATLILTSTDGIHWERELIHENAGAAVAFGNGRFVAVGSDVVTSTDGRQWTAQSAPGQYLQSVAFVNDRFVAVGTAGRITVSTEGVTWTERISGTTHPLRGITFGGGKYLAVGYPGTILGSRNTVTWEPEESGSLNDLLAVAFGRSGFVAVGAGGTTLSSSGSGDWSQHSFGSIQNLDGLALANGQIVAVGFGGTILTSTDGIRFTGQASGTDAELHGVAWGNGLWVAVGEPGVILTSPDAVLWTARSSGVTDSLKRAVFANGQWVVVGRSGTVLTSPDGVTWTRQSSGTDEDLNAVAYGNGVYVVAGDGDRPRGSLITSPDGANWTSRGSPAEKNLRGVIFADGIFLITGNDGVVLVSTNGMNWARRDTGISRNGANLRAAGWARGTWIVVGNGGLLLTSTNTYNWSLHVPQGFDNLHGVEEINGSFVTVGNGGTVLQSARLFATTPDARGPILGALGDLTPLERLAFRPQERQKLGGAVTHLDEALAMGRWLDDTFLAPRHGLQVFRELGEAVKQLEVLQKQGHNSIGDAQLQPIIGQLLTAARLLATAELEMATGAGLDAKKLAKAREEFARAEAAAAQDDNHGAIDHYRKAWQAAAQSRAKLQIHAVSGAVALEYLAMPGQTIALEASSNLKTWGEIGRTTGPLDGTVRFEDHAPVAGGSRFYRVRLLP